MWWQIVTLSMSRIRMAIVNILTSFCPPPAPSQWVILFPQSFSLTDSLQLTCCFQTNPSSSNSLGGRIVFKIDSTSELDLGLEPLDAVDALLEELSSSELSEIIWGLLYLTNEKEVVSGSSFMIIIRFVLFYSFNCFYWATVSQWNLNWLFKIIHRNCQ